jgi:hypothetical protein
MDTKTVLSLAFLTLLGASTVWASDTSFGFQVTLSKPQSDLDDAMDGKIGYGLGVHALVPFLNGHAIVPRVDSAVYSNSIDTDREVKFYTVTIGADYNYYVSRRAGEGFYLLGGLGFASGKYEYTYDTSSNSETKGTLYLQGGLGMAFTRNFGVELRYQHMNFSFDDATEKLATPSIQLSAFLRF